MVEFLIDNIFVKSGGHLFLRSLEFQWVPTVPPPPLLADLFLCTYGSDFLDNMIKSGHGNLPGHLICVSDISIVLKNEKLWEYFKDIYPSKFNDEIINQSDNLASGV